jgi:putative endonuclease
MPLPLFWSRLLPFWRTSEIHAAQFLRKQGFKIVASGFRVKEGEVDLIAWEDQVLVFIEVKSRKSDDMPEAAVGYTKQQRIMRAARAYLNRHRLHDAIYRFDIVTVNEEKGQKPSFRLIRDAFRNSRQPA